MNTVKVNEEVDRDVIDSLHKAKKLLGKCPIPCNRKMSKELNDFFYDTGMLYSEADRLCKAYPMSES